MEIEFLLNGETQRVHLTDLTQTVLDWLRETKGLTGTKEGCNEGDCGACTVIVIDEVELRSVNACILFMPQIHGKALRTVEGVGSGNKLHPIQRAMIEQHGSQCGFCTPGFVMSMVASHANGDEDFDTTLAGNLCRCTGYTPILKAAEQGKTALIPAFIQSDRKAMTGLTARTSQVRPKDLDTFANWYLDNTDATLIAGATDVALWVNKDLRALNTPCFLAGIRELNTIGIDETGYSIGAGVTVETLRKSITPDFPSLGEMLRRYGSTQVRNSATIGGNIANGSPIGDGPPALIALDATLILRHGPTRRELPLEDFFVDYGKQDLNPGEFVESIIIPKQPDRLKCYKLSKRFDQDISAVCGCFRVTVIDGKVSDVRIAFGGMAATPKRAIEVETALMGQNWQRSSIVQAATKFKDDFSPLTDARGSAQYRLRTAQNMLRRYFLEDQGEIDQILQVSP